MATPVAVSPLVERTDIHKCCKSLENILNILNEYCEAVGAIVALQKKLAKALRETAGLKGTGEIAANAMNGSAIVFEALFEIDTKYTKFTDKEYDKISTDVKKWFKKLVKEEKAHDQKLEKANIRIKQAGQSYEKKSKKNASDAAEEHARYINLISMLGPEISQEKYNHTLNVTQRHNATTYSVASALARIADAEWLKSCEGVRSIAPTIGTLTQWRILCEGGWSEGMPRGLPDTQDGQAFTSLQTDFATTPKSSPEIPDSKYPLGQDHNVPATPEHQHSPLSASGVSPIRRRQPLPSPHLSPNVSSQNLSTSNFPTVDKIRENLTPPGAFDTLKPPFFDLTTGSVRTLSAFPAPPTHLPIPPVRQQTQQSISHSNPSSASNTSLIPQFTDSPLSASQELIPHAKDSEPPNSPNDNALSSDYVTQRNTSSPEQRFRDHAKDVFYKPTAASPPQVELRRPQPVRSPPYSVPICEPVPLQGSSDSGNPRGGRRQLPNLQVKNDRHDQDAEFGVQRITKKAHTYDGLSSRNIERNDSLTSNGSIVAAMRDRYSSNPGSISPPPRDLPRIPLSVTDLAARYQSPESPPSRPRANSPPVARQMSFPVDHIRPRPDAYHHERMSHRPGSHSISTSTPAVEDDGRRRRQRAGDYTESEFKERERELQQREREIEARARELEQDRAHLMTVHEGSSIPSGRGNGDGSAQPPISPLRPRRVSLGTQLKRPLSQMELDEPLQPRAHFSNNLASSQGGNHGGYSGQSHTSSANGDVDYLNHRYSEEREATDQHAPYCGCHACSASKYGASLSAGEQELGPVGGNTLRPPSSPDKPKSGWMRRLSMPGMMSSAFNMDAKRNNSNYSLGSGVSNAVQKKGVLSIDGRKNSSVTSLLRAPMQDRA